MADPSEYDVYISYAPGDEDWAVRLAADVSARGVRCYHAMGLPGGGDWAEEVTSAVATSGVLVILWRPGAHEPYFARELARLEETGPIVPIFLDDPSGAPPRLRSLQGVTLSQRLARGGPDAEPDEWSRVVGAVAAQGRRASTTEESLAPNLAYVNAVGALGLGWVIQPELVAVPAGEELPPTLTVAIGEPGAGVAAATEARRHGVALLRLRSAVDRRLAPAATPHPGGPLLVAAQSPDGLVFFPANAGEQLPDGTYAIEAEGKAPAGPAWDDTVEHVIGIVVTDADGPRLVPPDLILPRRKTPPTARVHADRWTVEDQLGYALYARAIAEFVTHPDTTPPLVISVEGPWGQGKTSLMRMVQERLDPRHPDLVAAASTAPEARPSALTFKDLRDSLDGNVDLGDVKPGELRTVWFNAWKYQSSEAVWAGLAHALLQQLPSRLPPVEREKFWLKLQLRRIDPMAVRQDIHRAAFGWFLPRLVRTGVAAVVAVVGAALALAAGADALAWGGLGAVALTGVKAGLDWTWAERQALERHLEGSYQRYVRQPDYTERLGYLHLVEEDMYRALDLLTPDDRPTVVFIDDLDRCSPAKIGEVIEAINLFLAGDYPNCVFVLGIDAEVVAAAMEVVHKDVLEKLGDRRGGLGWRFMDKFVQLPFVMPRLNPGQRESFLAGLLKAGGSDDTDAKAVLEQAEQIRADIGRDAHDAAARVGEIAPRLAVADPEAYRELAEDAIKAGAASFSDEDEEFVVALTRQLAHLSDNPRTIKRAVNLYRFHRFASWAREASPLGLEAAAPDLIARAIVVIVRWPHFVRWLQTAPGAGLETAADDSRPWSDDRELTDYLRSGDLDLDRAATCGLW